MILINFQKRRCISAGVLVAAVLLGAGTASAAPSYMAWSEFSAYNWHVDPDTGGNVGRPAEYGAANQYIFSQTLAQSAMSGTAYATGLDQNGATATTTIDYASQAQASLAGGLKAEASISGSNFFWNSANAPYVNADASENAGGTPNFYSASSYSWVRDTLSVSGGPDLASVQFVFHLDGTLVGTAGEETNAWMSFSAGPTASSSSQSLFSTGTQLNGSHPLISLDQDVTSGMFNLVNGEVFLDLRLSTWADFGDLWGNSLSQPVGVVPDGSASSSFFNTVKIAQVLGFNAAGEQVSLYSVKGSDGSILPAASLPVSAVPEPATWAMMIMGFGLAGAGLRRSRAFAAA
jgi:hypothetical protein